jgi:molecular chaperone HscB
MLNVWVLFQVNFATLQDELEISEQYSALVNKAYSVLLQPLARGLYILQLHGINLEEDTTETDPQFLAEIMETNEELAIAQNPDDVRRLENDNKSMMDKLTR